MSQYKHLTLFEREKILFFMAQGYSVCAIAKELGRSKATISREIKRNSDRKGYMPVDAQAKYAKRRKRCGRKKLLEEREIYELVKTRFLEQQWSPEQIAGRMKLEGFPHRISYNTIYRAIYAGMFDTREQKKSAGNRGMKRRLRHKGKTRHKKGQLDNRGKPIIPHRIDERPTEAEQRIRLGDWEADTVTGKRGKACLVTLVDRKSRYLRCAKADSHQTEAVTQKMILLMENYPCQTITPDRGPEFKQHEKVTSATGAEFYFALPRHPWQRGTNENTNGLIREYFPKSLDLTDISDEEICLVERKLNFRPRKCLGFRSPFEVMFQLVLHLT